MASADGVGRACEVVGGRARGSRAGGCGGGGRAARPRGPAATISAASAGSRSTCSPTRKNVARAPARASASSTAGVPSGCGPSSKVRPDRGRGWSRRRRMPSAERDRRRHGGERRCRPRHPAGERGPGEGRRLISAGPRPGPREAAVGSSREAEVGLTAALREHALQRRAKRGAVRRDFGQPEAAERPVVHADVPAAPAVGDHGEPRTWPRARSGRRWSGRGRRRRRTGRRRGR